MRNKRGLKEVSEIPVLAEVASQMDSDNKLSLLKELTKAAALYMEREGVDWDNDDCSPAQFFKEHKHARYVGWHFFRDVASIIGADYICPENAKDREQNTRRN